MQRHGDMTFPFGLGILRLGWALRTRRTDPSAFRLRSRARHGSHPKRLPVGIGNTVAANAENFSLVSFSKRRNDGSGILAELARKARIRLALAFGNSPKTSAAL